MGLILIGRHTRIPASDENLDRIANLLEDPPGSTGGFWLAGQLEVETNGEPANPDPSYGHQRLWVTPGTLVTLVYDRPLHPDPDRIVDDDGTIYL
jgi:hypothetical protein